MSFNLAVILRESCAADPDKPLCHAGDETLSYARIDELSERIAAGLRGRGMRRGDKVAVQLPNLPQFVTAYFGILKIGAVMVPLNPLLRAPEVGYHLTDSDARVLITFEDFADEAFAGAETGGVETYVVHLPGNTERPAGTRSFEELYGTEDTGDIAPTAADDTAVLIYTSGTTGKPKGAELTHFQLFMNCTVAGELFGYRADDVALAVLPLFHIFGLSSVLNLGVRYGGTLVLMPRFDVTAVLDGLDRHGCTIFSGVPTMYYALAQAEPGERDLSALRVAVSGGAAMPGEVIRAFEAKFSGVVVLEGYGLSETASVTTFNISAEHRKIGSIGRPIWGVQVQVVDENDRALPPGADHVGEIVTRGHNVMKGYYKRPEATAEVLRDGWLHTGDLAYRDDDGYFVVVDRKKDLVLRGGYNVYPREIEEVLFTHPGVAEAAVIGKPDDKLGQEVLAFVVAADQRLTAETVIAYCKQQLAAYKYPREVRFVEALPMGPTGKILKKELRP